MEELNPKDSCPENETETEVGDKTKTESNQEDGIGNLDSVLTVAKCQETMQCLSLHEEISLAVDQGFKIMREMTGTLELELESSTLLDSSQFDILPIELKHEVLKRFSIETKKAARLVTKEWELILREHVKFTPILTSETFDHVCTSKQIFNEMTLTDMIWEVCLPKPRPTFVGRQNVQKLYFKEFSINTNILKWILVSCTNVEDIRVDFTGITLSRHFDEPGLFSFCYPVLPRDFSLCQKLIKFEIYIVQSNNLNSESTIDLDCSPLQFYKNLKFFNIRSSILVTPQNLSKLPKSMRRFNLILFYSGTEHQLSLKQSPQSKYLLSTEEFAQLTQHFPNLSTVEFVPNLQSEWEIFRNIISDVKSELYSRPVDSVNISTILNYSGIFLNC